MIRLFYSIAVLFLTGFIMVASLLHPKARQWWTGRKRWRKRLKKEWKGKEKPVWIHASSKGEYETALPIIERLKELHPDLRVVLTYFSPSGYKQHEKTELLDGVYYLPADTPWNMRKFVRLMDPQVMVLIKYELWPNMLRTLERKNCPVVLAAAVFTRQMIYFKSQGFWLRKHLHFIKSILVQDKRSMRLLKVLGIPSKICGDTRIDRVKKLSQVPWSDSVIEAFAGDKKLFIAGSTRKNDEKIIRNTLNELATQGTKILIAPHEVTQKTLHRLSAYFGEKAMLYSEGIEAITASKKIMILDQYGILSRAYRYSSLAYVGGGFTSGIHSILEPACYGIPSIFGYKNKKFAEAVTLKNNGGGFEVSSESEFKKIVTRLLENTTLLEQASQKSHQFISENIGATDKIVETIRELLG